MSMLTNTLGRYFAGRFVINALGVFASIFVLLVLVDYIEMVRKTSGLANASAITIAETSLFRVPQLLERLNARFRFALSAEALGFELTRHGAERAR